MKLRWLSDALSDLRAIKAYIAKENPQAASRVIASIRNEINVLLKQHNISRAGTYIRNPRTGHHPYPYIVAYREQSGEVQILAVVHTSRRWPEQLAKGKR